MKKFTIFLLFTKNILGGQIDNDKIDKEIANRITNFSYRHFPIESSQFSLNENATRDERINCFLSDYLWNQKQLCNSQCHLKANVYEAWEDWGEKGTFLTTRKVNEEQKKIKTESFKQRKNVCKQNCVKIAMREFYLFMQNSHKGNK